MKKFLLGAAFVLLNASVALATDMPIKAAAPAPAPFSWSGFYVGAHAGYGWGNLDTSDAVFIPPAIGNLKPGGWFGGVQAGYNNQFAPHWLLGGEIDFSWGDLHDSGTTTGAVLPIRSKLDYFGTARTRLGYVVDRSMLYVTGGAAWTHDKLSEGVAGAGWFDSAYRVGWTIGGGYEFAINRNWSAKIEYLYADLGHYRSINNASLLRTADLTANLVRFGLNYRFDGSAPVSKRGSMPVKAAPALSWTGGYIGANGIYATADLKSLDTFFGPAQSSSVRADGWFAGLQSGYNWQFPNNWVIGIETDNSFGQLKKNSATSPGGFPVAYKIDDFGTVRGRLGYAFDRSLIYGTGGLAYARVRFTETVGGATGMGLDGYRAGWALGGGWEYAFNPDWSAKIEYLYADLGKQHLNDVNGNARTVDAAMNTVKIGVNYRGELLDRFFAGK